LTESWRAVLSATAPIDQVITGLKGLTGTRGLTTEQQAKVKLKLLSAIFEFCNEIHRNIDAITSVKKRFLSEVTRVKVYINGSPQAQMFLKE
jgi:hypothetical protein